MKDLYQSGQWKSLNKIDRAQLLLVIEGLKRGTIVGGDWTSMPRIIKDSSLEYRLNSHPFHLDPVFVISKSEDFRVSDRRLLTSKRLFPEVHYIDGWLLGYPLCCTKEYVRKRSAYEELLKKEGHWYLSYRFGRELHKQIVNHRTYPEILDYRPPSFTPCSIDCPEATKLLAKYKEALDTLDPEAGAELAFFNRKSYPERMVHMQQIHEETKKRNLEFRLYLLRKSING